MDCFERPGSRRVISFTILAISLMNSRDQSAVLDVSCLSRWHMGATVVVTTVAAAGRGHCQKNFTLRGLGCFNLRPLLSYATLSEFLLHSRVLKLLQLSAASAVARRGGVAGQKASSTISLWRALRCFNLRLSIGYSHHSDFFFFPAASKWL